MANSEWSGKGVKISWTAINIPGVGACPAFALTIPAGSSGRVDIFRVPVCTSYPDGYWYNLDPQGSVRKFVEPGCLCWEKTVLARIRVSDTTVTEGDGMEGVQEPVIEYAHPDLKNYISLEAV